MRVRKVSATRAQVWMPKIGWAGFALARTRLARSIYDPGWGILARLIEEKASEAGRTIVHAPRSFPSTRLCSTCWEVGDRKPLHVRAWACGSCGCGATHDRDVNAAINLRDYAIEHMATEHVAAGQAQQGSPPDVA